MSDAFHALKKKLEDDVVRREFEWLLDIAVRQYSPSERGNRWIIGGIVEWAIALVLLESGAIALPDGHNANGHDLQGLVDETRNLWSVKSSFSPGLGDFIISNGMGGVGAGLKTPTVFAHPKLPGLVYLDPLVHTTAAEKVVAKAGETRLHSKVVLEHAQEHPDCVATFKMPINQGASMKSDPALTAVKQILSSDVFHILNKSIRSQSSDSDVKMIDSLERLNKLKSNGFLSSEQVEIVLISLLKENDGD